MKFFLDTASLKDISWAAQAGLIDGVTTNPSLLAKQAGDLDPKDVLKEICSLVEGPVSAEVVAVDTEGMLKEGKELAKIADNIVVKIPMLEDGMVAAPRLGRDPHQRHALLLERAMSHRRQGRRELREPLHRAARRCGPGGHGRDPRGARDLRQLRHRDRYPGRVDPPSAP